jgi:hypothetical protein
MVKVVLKLLWQPLTYHCYTCKWTQNFSILWVLRYHYLLICWSPTYYYHAWHYWSGHHTVVWKVWTFLRWVRLRVIHELVSIITTVGTGTVLTDCTWTEKGAYAVICKSQINLGKVTHTYWGLWILITQIISILLTSSTILFVPPHKLSFSTWHSPFISGYWTSFQRQQKKLRTMFQLQEKMKRLCHLLTTSFPLPPCLTSEVILIMTLYLPN